MAEKQKKLAAATLARRIDQWHRDLYGESIFEGTKSVAEFIEDVKQAEFEENMRQIPGQQQIRAKKDGNVEIADYDAPQEPEDEDTKTSS